MRLSGVMGFITNSSSVVYHFPNELLQDERIKFFIENYELNGHVGREMWNRQDCDTIAFTAEQKNLAHERMVNHGYDFDVRSPAVETNGDNFVIIYGDEYHSITHVFASLVREIAEQRGVNFGRDDYN